MATLNRQLRTADLTRRAGRSVQQVRNLERDGVLAPTGRTPSGYRTWTEAHAEGAATYVTLAAAVGPVEAKTIMRIARTGEQDDMLFGAVQCRWILPATTGWSVTIRDAGCGHVVTGEEPTEAGRPGATNTAGRLTGVDRQDAGTDYGYCYDADGNITKRINAVPPARSSLLTYNSGNQQTGTGAPTHDADGSIRPGRQRPSAILRRAWSLLTWVEVR